MSGIRHTVRDGFRPAAGKYSVFTEPGAIPRLNQMPGFTPYVYHGTGLDILDWMAETTRPPAPAPRPGAEPVAVTIAMARLCGACRRDCAGGCRGGSCPCACQDEPLRCAACGYLETAPGHLIACGRAA